MGMTKQEHGSVDCHCLQVLSQVRDYECLCAGPTGTTGNAS